jgi:hypothetical protein
MKKGGSVTSKAAICLLNESTSDSPCGVSTAIGPSCPAAMHPVRRQRCDPPTEKDFSLYLEFNFFWVPEVGVQQEGACLARDGKLGLTFPQTTTRRRMQLSGFKLQGILFLVV